MSAPVSHLINSRNGIPMHQRPFVKRSSAKNQEQGAVDLTEGAIGEREFADLLGSLGPFEENPKLAIALSGGADSIGLCLLCQRWCQAVGGTLQALLVDHGLRQSSGIEGKLVASWLSGLDIPFEVLRWQDEKPKSGIQAKARDARYALLETRCRELGILHLLTAHHFNDQAETIEMRRIRASSMRGLAGMAAIVERDHVRLLRPLLSVAKSRIIATVRKHEHAWIDDPSNQDLKFERSRMRAAIGFARPSSPKLVRQTAEGRCQMEQSSAKFFAAHAFAHPLGFVSIDKEAWQALDHDLACMILQKSIQAASGSAYPVGLRRIDRLIREVGALPEDCRRTIGGSIVTLGLRRMRILREPAAIQDRRSIPNNKTIIWDGRFKLRYCGTESDVMVSNAGDREVDEITKLIGKNLKKMQLPTTVLRTLPCVISERHGTLFLGPYRLREPKSERFSFISYSRNPLAGVSFAMVTVA